MTVVCLNGRYLDEKKASISIRDAGFLYGEGIYETMRTKRGKVFNVQAHLKRLGHAARFLSIPLPSRAELVKWIQQTVDRNGLWKKGHESRIRLTISGGVHEFDALPKTPTVLVRVLPLDEMVEKNQRRGVSVITFRMERFLPEIKTTILIPALLARRAMKKAKAYEVLFVDHRGRVTEGSITNFFIVHDGRLMTPRASILEGTTRKRVIQLSRKLRIPLIEKNISVEQLYSADEMFICNAPRGIVPVKKVDGRRIGVGKVGEVTKKLLGGLDRRL